MSAATFVDQKLFGLIELDAAGTILYSRIEQDGDAGASVADLTGRNFFTEIAPFKNIEEFRQLLDSFNQSSQQADSIRFIFDYEDGHLPVKILLARIRERSEQDVTKSILVHIRKVE